MKLKEVKSLAYNYVVAEARFKESVKEIESEIGKYIAGCISFEQLDALGEAFSEVGYNGIEAFYLLRRRRELKDQIPTFADIA